MIYWLKYRSVSNKTLISAYLYIFISEGILVYEYLEGES